jgi:hypothetical protein
MSTAGNLRKPTFVTGGVSPRPMKQQQVKIRTQGDLSRYLEECSGQAPIMEGHVCKDISKPRVFDRFRRRYFVLYRGVLLYYNYKSQFDKDKRKGFVSYYTMTHYLW